MNLIQIAGYLGSDAEERFTPNGKKVISLRVATRAWQGGKEETIWWRVSLWGDRFDKLVPYLRKGAAVVIVGEMGKPETYVDREGKTQVSLNITAEIVKFSPFGKGEKNTENQQGTGRGEKTHDRNAEPVYQEMYSGMQASRSADTSSQMVGFGISSMNREEDEMMDDLPF